MDYACRTTTSVPLLINLEDWFSNMISKGDAIYN